MRRIFKRIVALTIVLCTLATMMIPSVYAEENQNLEVIFATAFETAGIASGKNLLSTFSQLNTVYDINKWTVYCDETGNYVRPNNLYAGGRYRVGTLEVRNHKIEAYGATATLPSVFIAPGSGAYQLSVDYSAVSSVDPKGAELGAYILEKPEIAYSQYNVPGPDAAEILTKATEQNPGDAGTVYGDNIVILEEGVEYILVFYVTAADMTPASANFKAFRIEQVEMEPEYTTEGTELPTENDWPTAPPVIIEPTEPVMPTLPAEPVEPDDYLQWEIVDGQAIITACDTAISGDLIIPDILDGYPVTGIGEYAFNDCGNLTEITIPDSVTSIGDYAFYYCAGLESIAIPESITSIGVCVFYCCSNLKSITIPSSMTSVGVLSFAVCDSLTDVYYNGSQKQWNAIDINAGNDALTNATIHFAVEDTEENVWEQYLTWEIVDGQATITGCDTAISGDLVIPDTLDGCPVTAIGDYAFSGCSSLTSIEIPDSVTSIGIHAFSSCRSLTSIVIPDSVSSIGSGAFSACSSLRSIMIPDSVTSISYDAFYNCSSLTSIEIPDSVISIGRYAFDGCSSLTDVYYDGTEEQWNAITIGASNEYLTNATIHTAQPEEPEESGWEQYLTWEIVDGEAIITACDTSISGDLVIPDTLDGCPVTAIGDYAFPGCTGLTSVVIPDSVTRIGYYAFLSCSGLTSITIPENVAIIEQGALEDCTGMTSIWVDEDNEYYSSDSYGILFNKEKTELVKAPAGFVGAYTIPDGVTTVGVWAFMGCKNLTEITIADSVTEIVFAAFSGCTSLTSAYIGNGLTTIPNSMFSNCTSLNTVIMPDSVTNIDNSAFYGCTSLTAITIPNGVTAIAENAFFGCNNLATVTIPDSVTSICEYAFAECTSLTTVYYGGTAAQKEQIVIAENNHFLTNANWICKEAEEPGIGGACGDNLTWTLADGVLTVSGAGKMWDAFLWDGSIPWDAYRDQIKKVVINSGVTNVGAYMFANCSNLTSVELPEGITSIDYNAFWNCYNLTDINLPYTLRYIDGEAFYCCGITTLEIPKGVTAIYDSAFRYSSLEYVTIPASVTTIGSWAFSTNSLKKVEVDPDNAKFCSGANGELLSKDEKILYQATNVAEAYVVADTVTTIYDGAFECAYNMTSIVLPAGITKICFTAFDGCSKLTDVYFGGTQEQWDAITIDALNDALLNATVHIAQPEEPEEPVVEELLFTVESKTVVKNREFTVTVEVTKNPGFAYLEVTPLLPAEFTLVKVENGELASDFTSGRQYIWVADEDVTKEGLLLTFTFLADDSVESGNYQIGFILRSSANYAEKLLSLGVVGGEIQVIDVVYGDATGDGKVDGLDVLRLKKYLADYDYDTESASVAISLGADANGDGKIDGLDVLRLKKYLAEYNYETGESPIVLGPQ